MNGDVLNANYKLTYYPVDDLEEGTAYEFEVVAVYESYGESEPLAANPLYTCFICSITSDCRFG